MYVNLNENITDVQYDQAILEIADRAMGFESVQLNPIQDFFGMYGMESAFEPVGKLTGAYAKLRRFIAFGEINKFKQDLKMIEKLNPELVSDEETEVKVNKARLAEVTKFIGDLEKVDVKPEVIKEIETGLKAFRAELEKYTTDTETVEKVKKVSKTVVKVLDIINAVLGLITGIPALGVVAATLGSGAAVVTAGVAVVSYVISMALRRFVAYLVVATCAKVLTKALTEAEMVEVKKLFEEHVGSKVASLVKAITKVTGINLDSEATENVTTPEVEEKTYTIGKAEKIELVNALKALDVKALEEALNPVNDKKLFALYDKAVKVLDEVKLSPAKFNAALTALEVKKGLARKTISDLLNDCKKY